MRLHLIDITASSNTKGKSRSAKLSLKRKTFYKITVNILLYVLCNLATYQKAI